MEENTVKASVLDAYDYKGAPADNAATGGWISATMILGIEVCERLTTMGIAVNLVTYLVNTMHQSSATSSNIVTNFSGTAFLLSLLGGCIADSFLGRYWTIAIFAVIEALGSGILAISTALPHLRPPPCNPSLAITCEEASSLQMAVFYAAVYLIAVGIGGVKSSVSAFGTDQFDHTNEKEKTQMAYFFNRFYLLINIGTILAVTVLVYIQDDVSRGWGYGICSAAMFIAVLVFLSGTRRYRYKKCLGSPIIQILQVMVAAVRKRRLQFPSSVSLLFEDDSSPESKICHTYQFRWLDKASISSNGDFGKNGAGTPNPWRLCTVTRVEELKMMIRILPIWATTITYWAVHAQMITFSVQQAASMDRCIGKFEVPAASFSAFFIGATMITLLVYDRLIMPLQKKSGLTSLQKIGLGLVISVVAMAIAAGVEVVRLSVIRSKPNNTTSTLPISAFILIPQFVVVGVAEAFIYSGQLAFFISQAPKGMKAISNSLFLTTIAFGFFLTSLLVTIVKRITGGGGREGWLAPEINNGRLDYFYGLLSALSFINLGLYILCAAWYKPDSGEKMSSLDTDAVASREDEDEEKG